MLEHLQKEAKRLPDLINGDTIEQAWRQVRNQAATCKSDGSVLLASLEHLSDTAIMANHAEQDYYKVCTKQCEGYQAKPSWVSCII